MEMEIETCWSAGGNVQLYRFNWGIYQMNEEIKFFLFILSKIIKIYPPKYDQKVISKRTLLLLIKILYKNV